MKKNKPLLPGLRIRKERIASLTAAQMTRLQGGKDSLAIDSVLKDSVMIDSLHATPPDSTLG